MDWRNTGILSSATAPDSNNNNNNSAATTGDTTSSYINDNYTNTTRAWSSSGSNNNNNDDSVVSSSSLSLSPLLVLRNSYQKSLSVGSTSPYRVAPDKKDSGNLDTLLEGSNSTSSSSNTNNLDLVVIRRTTTPPYPRSTSDISTSTTARQRRRQLERSPPTGSEVTSGGTDIENNNNNNNSNNSGGDGLGGVGKIRRNPIVLLSDRNRSIGNTKYSNSSIPFSFLQGIPILHKIMMAVTQQQQQQQQQRGGLYTATSIYEDDIDDSTNTGGDGSEVSSTVLRKRRALGHNNYTTEWSYKVPFIAVSILLLILIIQLAFTTVSTTSASGRVSSTQSLLLSLFTGTTSSKDANGGTGLSCLQRKRSKQQSLLVQNENALLQALADDDDQNGDFIVVANGTVGVVASDQQRCSDMGLDILKLGGNAIDAAVTTALCIGVVNPSSSGLGGGGFMLLLSDPVNKDEKNNDNTIPPFHDARDMTKEPIQTNNGKKVVEVIDCREIAPAGATVNMYIDTTQPKASVLGGLAIAVPGELRGLELAHARHGVLPWRQVVEPIVTLASNGIPVSKYLAHVIRKTSANMVSSTIYNASWGLRNFITHGNDWENPYVEGELLRNPLLVQTLTDIMNGGADAVYKGTRAEQLAADIQQAGGIVTADDIQNYKPTIRTPIVSTPSVNGFAVVGVPPPSSGGAVIIGALRFLAGFTQPLSTFADTLSIHRIVEAMKHVFSIRMSLSDPDYNTETVTAAVHDLVYGPYMEELRQNHYYDNTTLSSLQYYGGTKWSQLDEHDGKNENVTDAKEGDRRRHRRLTASSTSAKQQSSTKDRTNDDQSHTNLKQNPKSRPKRRRLYRSHGHLDDSGTSHFSIVDKDGNAVSMTTSINTVFGSMVVSPSTGILLGNTMDDFANPGLQDFFGIKPSEANYIAPFKKPLSSMSPTLVFEQPQYPGTTTSDQSTTEASSPPPLGKLIMAIGGSGGPKIITAVLQVILNHIYLGRTMLESIIHPRVHNQLIYHGSSITMLERATLDHIVTNIQHDILIGITNRTQQALQNRYHTTGTIDYTGCVQAVAIDYETGVMTGASDVRKGGAPAGL